MLRAMRERLFDPGALRRSGAGFTEELNRLRRGTPNAAGDRATRDRRLQSALEGNPGAAAARFRDEAWKDELRGLEQRRTELEVTIAAGATTPPPPALQPQMAVIFQQKATQLAEALAHDEQRDAARQTLRGFLEKIVIPPGEGLLQVVGNLREMWTAAGSRHGSAVAAVAQDGCGGLQPRYLQLWSGTA